MPTYEQLVALGAEPAGAAAPTGGGLTYDQLVKAGAQPVTAPETKASPEAPPGLFGRFKEGVSKAANIAVETPGNVAKFLGRAIPAAVDLVSPISKTGGFQVPFGQLIDPAYRHELERGISDTVTGGLAERAANAVDPKFAAAAASEAAAHPGVREAGGLVGSALPSPFSRLGTAAGEATAASRLISKLPAPVRAGLAAATGGAAAAGSQAAAAGADLPEILGSAGGAGLVSVPLGATAGAAKHVADTAPARVLDRAAEDITTGEQNAKMRTARKVAAKAGENGEGLRELFDRNPDLEKEIAINAKSSPEKVAKAVNAKTADVGAELDDIYDTMSKAGRTVTPSDIAINFDKMLADRLREGNLDAVQALRKVRAQFLNEYGNFGKLSPETMRGLKATAGRAAFAGDPTAPVTVKQQVTRDVWRVFSDAIEKHAEGVKDVDVDRLRALNKDMSVLLPVGQALDERVSAARAGRKSLTELFGHGLSTVGGAALGAGLSHSPLGLAAGVAAPVAAKLGKRAVRAVDYGLAKRFATGPAPDVAVAAGSRAGQLEYASRVAEGLRAGLSLEDAVAAAKKE